MEFRELIISTKTPEFAPLTVVTLQCEENYREIPCEALPTTFRGDCNSVFYALTGRTMPEEAFIRAGLKAGPGGTKKINKLYAPAVYKQAEPETEAPIAIRWGNEYIGIMLEKGSIKPLAEVPKGYDVELTFEYTRIQYEEAAIVAVVTTPEGDELTMPFRLYPASYETPIGKDGVKVIKSLLKQGKIEDILALLGEPKQGGGNDGIPVVDAVELEESVTYELIEAKPVKMGWGPSNILTVNINGNKPIKVDGVEYANQIKVWSNAPVNTALASGLVLPCKFYTEQREGKTRTIADINLIDAEVLNKPNMIDLAFLA